MIRILTKNGVDNTNVDGARDHNFNAGRRSGIVQGALNQGNFFASNNNTIALDTCELRLCGHRIVLDKAEYRTFTNKPSVPVRYSFVARVVVDSDDNVSFEFVSQEATTQLVQNNLDITGSGTYELEIGKFTQLTDGTITDVVRTADLITGGADNDSDYIRIGTVTTNKISPELDADVDIENTINPTDNKPQTNFTFNLPTAVGTVVSVNGEEKTAINTDLTPTANSSNLITSGGVHDYPAVAFAESERQKSKNLWGSELQKGCYLFADGTLDKSNDAYASNKTLISVKPNSTITISATSFEINNDSGFVFFKDGQYVGYSRGVVSTMVPSNANQVAFNFYKTGVGNDFSLISNIQLEYGSVATDYQPYNGEIIHEKKLNEIVNGKYPIDINACTTYDQVFNKLQNAVYGQCGIGTQHTSAIKSLLPAFPTNASYVDCIANIIKNQHYNSTVPYAIRFTGCPFGFNQPIYYCDVFYDGEYTIVTGWYKPETVELLYDLDTKNTIGGTPYTAGIPFSSISISNVDFTSYKYLRFTCRWNAHGDNWFGGAITFDLDLTTPYNSDAEYMSVVSSRPSSCHVADDATTFDLVGRITVNGNKNLLAVNGYKITYTGQRTAYTSDNYLQYFRIEKIEGIK